MMSYLEYQYCIAFLYHIYIYSEHVMDDRDISDIWTSDSNIWRVNESYIVGTSEYIWCVTVVHKVFYVFNVSLKWTTNSTRIYMSKKYIEQLRCHT